MNQFLPWDILLIKKLELKKRHPPSIQLLKLKSGLSFFDFQLFKGRNRFVEKNTFSALFAFTMLAYKVTKPSKERGENVVFLTRIESLSSNHFSSIFSQAQGLIFKCMYLLLSVDKN